eukprot:5536002-Karenia_brevis.AAC.1
MGMGMGLDISATEAVGTLQQQAKLGRDRALDPKHQGDGQSLKSGRAHERHQGGMRVCSVNITYSSKKAIHWLQKLPYE